MIAHREKVVDANRLRGHSCVSPTSATSHAGRPIPPPIPSTPEMTAPLCRRLRGQIAIGACRSTMPPHDQATPLVPTYRVPAECANPRTQAKHSLLVEDVG